MMEMAMKNKGDGCQKEGIAIGKDIEIHGKWEVS